MGFWKFAGWSLLLLGACTNPAVPEQPEPQVVLERSAGDTVSVVGVHVLDPETRTVQRHRTVRLEGGVVVSVDSGGAAAGSVLRAEGEVWVLPGLHDLHVHLFDTSELWLYLANGVTTVRNLSGVASHLAWRDSLASGAWPGPRLLTSGPILDGDPPSRSTNTVLRTAQEADAEVRRQADAGYDYIKIYDNVSREVYDQIVSSAAAVELPVVGHLPTPVGLEYVLENPRQIEIQHSEELFPYILTGRSTVQRVGSDLAGAGIHLVPTLGVMESARRHAAEGIAVLSDPEVALVSARIRDLFRWEATVRERAAQPGAEAGFAARLNAAGELALEVRRAGGRILAGSDAPIPTLVPGFSLHDELSLLAEAGVDPWDVLAAATSVPAQLIGDGVSGGRVVPGGRADLVLLGGNPADDMAHTRRILAVVVGGQVWTAEELQARLTELAEGGRP